VLTPLSPLSLPSRGTLSLRERGVLLLEKLPPLLALVRLKNTDASVFCRKLLSNTCQQNTSLSLRERVQRGRSTANTLAAMLLLLAIAIAPTAYAAPKSISPSNQPATVTALNPNTTNTTSTVLTTVLPAKQPLQGDAQSPPQINVTKGRSQIVKFAQPVIRVSIADPTLADVVPLSPDQLMINGKQRGVTSLVVWDEKGQEGLFDLQITNDTTELIQAVKALAPNEDVGVKITDDSFILSGKLSNSVSLDEIKKLASAYGYKDANFIDLSDTQPTQVQLKVKIVEASRDMLRGLKASVSYSDKNLQVFHLPYSRTNIQPGATTSIFPALVAGVTPSFSSKTNISLDMLESTGKITTLAEPTLMVTHGRTADFLAGGEFPYVTGVGQNGIPTIAFREYGVKLKFTPWLNLKSNRMEMTIAPEVSAIDRANCVSVGGTGVCGITKRTSTTTVGLNNDETLIISGILSQNDEKELQKLPFIADIPVLGTFFKNSTTRHNERELVIIVTPHIMPFK
jgi:pilus assembly protein CpaC